MHLASNVAMYTIQLPILPSKEFSRKEPDLLLGIDEYSKIVESKVTELPSGFSIYHTRLGAIV
jgi:hypothetical protein